MALRVDGCRHGRTRRNKSHIGNKPSPGRAKHWRTNAIIHCGNSSSCKRSARRRTRNGRTQIPPSKTSLLHAQELSGWYAENAFFRVKLDVVCSEVIERKPQVICTEHFVWTDAAATGLDEIKTLLASNPVLTAPNIGEPMLLYIATTHQVVSAVLVVERETMKPSSFLEGTLKTHFSGFSLMSYVRRLSNVSLKSSIRVSMFLVFMTMLSNSFHNAIWSFLLQHYALRA